MSQQLNTSRLPLCYDYSLKNSLDLNSPLTHFSSAVNDTLATSFDIDAVELHSDSTGDLVTSVDARRPQNISLSFKSGANECRTICKNNNRMSSLSDNDRTVDFLPIQRNQNQWKRRCQMSPVRQKKQKPKNEILLNEMGTTAAPDVIYDENCSNLVLERSDLPSGGDVEDDVEDYMEPEYIEAVFDRHQLWLSLLLTFLPPFCFCGAMSLVYMLMGYSDFQMEDYEHYQRKRQRSHLLLCLSVLLVILAVFLFLVLILLALIGVEPLRTFFQLPLITFVHNNTNSKKSQLRSQLLTKTVNG